MSSSTCASPAPTSRRGALRDKIDVLVLADDARVLEAGGGRGGRGLADRRQQRPAARRAGGAFRPAGRG